MDKRTFIKALKLSFVPRWVIIDMRRTQHVSDHVYRTQIILVHLIEKLKIVNSVNMEYAVFLALMHDVEEGETGDTPSSCKDTNYTFKPSASKEHALLRLADAIEASIWLHRYGVKPNRVARFLEAKVQFTQKELSVMFKIPERTISAVIDDIVNAGCEHD